MFKVRILDSLNSHPEFTCKEQETILDAASSQGIKIDYACKGGGCGLCKIRIAEGVFERGKSSKAVLPDSERALNYTLACKTYPKSDIKVLIQLS